MTTTVPYRPLPLDLSDVRYAHSPDSVVQPGVPVGETVELDWSASAVYPGTSRKFWVHVPAQYDPAEPAALMVFQDGRLYLDPEGEVRGGIVLDNLIHSGDIPVTIGVFVDPGVLPDAEDPKNRNVEYDAFDDRYVTFLLEEILPEVTSRYAVTTDPDRWGICGGSSGGNCAFTAAWFRPDRFRRVITCLSSFAQMPGGNPYPELIPGVPGKPLRVFMQAGHRDLGWDQPGRNWLAENLRVAAALAEAGYDVRLALGDGGHNPNHGGVLLPDALRWLLGRPGTAAAARTVDGTGRDVPGTCASVGRGTVRPATADDLEALLDVQEEGAVAGLAHIFPQDTHPFPRAELLQRWSAELEDPAINVYVSLDASGALTGFAATRGAELLHFGTAVRTWGTGAAQQLHDAVLGELSRTAPVGSGQLRLRVFEANHRARRFYEKLGWTGTGQRTHTSFPPHPVLVEYHRSR
ncbi:GNAT family N-acetyltransferase [Oryzihumus leptocrescens]|uniref:Enterochelin esterase-like enzyme n=1 Tax=Oryzihumus leptocrescens TaxID=297536 RepID=A0A542ZLN4_9MICO|nr:GNAT family N-acetyltransferase [Oryzihumus leptocrescens]TQL61090.1 enterochelin esterase-like enzyme [Oryzihumus leptocrescens]